MLSVITPRDLIIVPVSLDTLEMEVIALVTEHVLIFCLFLYIWLRAKRLNFAIEMEVIYTSNNLWLFFVSL